MTDTKPVEVKKSKLDDFCKAIEIWEDYVIPGGRFRNGTLAPQGSVSWRNRNPGNLKFADQVGTTGKDPQGHAIFSAYEYGFKALKRQVELVATGKSKAYNQAAKRFELDSCSNLTIEQFFSIYAEDNSRSYASFVAGRCGLLLTSKIKEVL